MPLIEKEENYLAVVSSSSYLPLLKRFLVRVCVAATLAIVFMGAIEFYAYRRYAKYGENEVLEPAVRADLAANGNSDKSEYWREFEAANRVLYHQYVLWRRRPYSGRLLAIDENGVRRTLNSQCDGQNVTIWTFGDSVMWGAGVPDSDTIPSRIAKLYADAGKPVCIVNYAEKGWSNTQEMLALLELLKHAQRKPNIVLFYDGGTEAFAAYQNGQADVHSNYSSFKDFLDNWGVKQKASFSYLQETNTYRMLERIASKTPFHNQSESQPHAKLDTESLSEAVVANYIQNIDIINLLGKQYGFRPVFVWYPNLAVGHKKLTDAERQVLRFQYEQFPDMGGMYQAVYARSAEITRPDFYNLGDVVDDQKNSLYVGISHMNAEGDEIVARRLFEILEDKSPRSATTRLTERNATGK